MPDKPDLQEILNEIGDLKGMLGNTLDIVLAIKKSLVELERELAALRNQID